MSPIARYAAQFGSASGGALLDALPWVIVIVGAAAVTAWFTGAIHEGEMATLREKYTKAEAIAERDARQTLQAAQDRGDALTTDLHAANRAAMRYQEQLDDALRRATTGRACLDGAALRLLDRASGIALRVPASASGVAGADGRALAADTATGDARLFATDTDVALWAGRAAGQYAECRRRLDALIDWHTEPPQQ